MDDFDDGNSTEEVSKEAPCSYYDSNQKMAQALTDYLTESGFKVKYIHSDVDTLDRIEIIEALRRGKCDILIGINLLRRPYSRMWACGYGLRIRKGS